MQDSSIAVIGLGLIGSIWAANYRRDGVLAASWNRSEKPELELLQGSLEDCARQAELLQLCLYDAASVEAVLDQLEPFLEHRHTLIQSSTIDPGSAARLAARVRRAGARYVEAPFTGSKPAAEARETVFFLGGEAEAIEAVEPTLARISQRRFVIGSPEQAATIKLAMNLQIAAITEALCESLTMSRRAGIDDEIFFSAMKKNVAWSGLAALKEPKVREGEFSPQFSIKNMHKDMRLAEAAAGDLPILREVRACLERCEEAGYGEDDFISLLRVLRNPAP